MKLRISALIKIIFFVVTTLAFLGCKQKDIVQILPVKDFFKNPEKSDFQISPDGKYISYLAPYNDQLNVFVKPVGSDSIIRLTSFSDFSIKNQFWAGNNYIIYTKNDEEGSNIKIFIVTKDGKSCQKVNINNTTKLEFVGQFKTTDRYVLIATNELSAELLDVYKLDLETGEKVLVQKNPGNVVSWVTDQQNEIRLALGREGLNDILYYKEKDKPDFKKIKVSTFPDSFKPVSFSAEENVIFAFSNVDRDKIALVKFDCKTGKEVEVVHEDPDSDIIKFFYSKKLNKILFVSTELEKRKVTFFDEKVRKINKTIIRLLEKDKVAELVDIDVNENFFLFFVYSDKNAGAYYLYNTELDNLTELGKINSSIEEENMASVKPIKFQNREDSTIYGYLTLPNNKFRNLPVVVLLHDGPYKRDRWKFNNEVQFLANRGYAVLQINFRGSTGYGKKFLTQGFKNWTGNISNDIEDGVRWLNSLKISDPNKIAVMGHGFGGFSALDQIIQNPKLYKCVISNSGYINLFSYLKGIPVYYKLNASTFNEMIGNPENDIEYLKQSSPIFHAKNIKKPILIYQGSKDLKVNVNEINQFVRELKNNKVDVTYILNENEGHEILDFSNQQNFYKKVELFLSKNLNGYESR